MAYNKDEFERDWYKGVKVSDMAVKYDISPSSVSRRAVKVLGLPSRRAVPDIEKEKQIVEYYKTSSILKTARRFNVAKITVQRAAMKFGFSKLEKPRKRNYTVSRYTEPKPSVRVLDAVPDDFSIPDRVVRW